MKSNIHLSPCAWLSNCFQNLGNGYTFVEILNLSAYFFLARLRGIK